MKMKNLSELRRILATPAHNPIPTHPDPGPAPGRGKGLGCQDDLVGQWDPPQILSLWDFAESGLKPGMQFFRYLPQVSSCVTGRPVASKPCISCLLQKKAADPCSRPLDLDFWYVTTSSFFFLNLFPHLLF